MKNWIEVDEGKRKLGFRLRQHLVRDQWMNDAHSILEF